MVADGTSDELLDSALLAESSRARLRGAKLRGFSLGVEGLQPV